jgi:ABC-type amino acid transport system permease subunit
MRPQIVTILVVILFMFNAITAYGQDLSSGPPAPNRTPPPPELPLDTSIFVLIALGLIYGIYISYKKFNAKHKVD